MGINGQYMDCNWTSFTSLLFTNTSKKCAADSKKLDLKFKANLKLESGNQKIWYGHQAAILKVTYLKINRLLSIHTSNVLLKFGLYIQSQTEVRVRKLKNPLWSPGGHFDRWKSICFCPWPPTTCIWNLKLKFQSKLELRSGNHVAYRRMDRRTDRQTDGQGDSNIPPPTSLGGGIIMDNHGNTGPI